MEQVITTERLPIKLWLDDIEDGALEQAKNLANLWFAYKWVAVMADSHRGFGMPIGGVLATNGVIVPNAVGVDIGCGMVAVRTSLTDVSKDELMQAMGLIRENVPLGFNHNKEAQVWAGFDDAPDIEIIQQQLFRSRKQLGTLGGGNHFIEIQKGSDGHIWLMIHSGSRNFGLQIARVYHKKAVELCKRWLSDIPHPDLSFLPMDEHIGREYKEAMEYAMRFAEANRALMMERTKQALSDATGVSTEDFVEYANINHNDARMEHHYGKNVLVHRKGATRARENMIGIIPGSMGSPSYIVRGKGNPESFESCSHGAGRRMGRNEARRTLSLQDEQEKMAGILGGPRNQKDLDEARGAYKEIGKVMAFQADLVEIDVELTPLANIKS